MFTMLESQPEPHPSTGASQTAGNLTEHGRSPTRDHEDIVGSPKAAENLRVLGQLADAESMYRLIRLRERTNLAATIALGQIKRQARDLETSLDLFREDARH
jgi:hypothetical protein